MTQSEEAFAAGIGKLGERLVAVETKLQIFTEQFSEERGESRQYRTDARVVIASLTSAVQALTAEVTSIKPMLATLAADMTGMAPRLATVATEVAEMKPAVIEAKAKTERAAGAAWVLRVLWVGVIGIATAAGALIIKLIEWRLH